jgi:hypothetical protein
MKERKEPVSEWTETEILETMSKPQLIELLGFYSQCLYTMNGLWFIGASRTVGPDAAVEFDAEVWCQFGALEAKRLKRFLGMRSVTTLEDVCRIVLLSPMWISVGPKAEIRDDVCTLSVTNCHPQKAWLKQGQGELPCRSMGTAYFEGFAPALNTRLRYRCVFCPPDEHPDNVWCKWEVDFATE